MTLTRLAVGLMVLGVGAGSALAQSSPLTPPLSAGSITIDDAPEPGVEPFLMPPTEDNPLKQLPDNDKYDYAYGAFQRGFYLTAFSIAIELAKKNDAAAQTLVGYLFANGLGVPQKPDEAVTWYELAVKAGEVNAMMELANLYAIGAGTERNPKRAAELLEAALAKGRRDAAYWLGLIYLDRNSPVHDPKKAATNFKIAADDGSPDGQYALATMLADGLNSGIDGNLEEAARLMGQAALAGHIPAKVEYAIMVFNGKGVKADEKTAAAWFLDAAKAGNRVAESRLARLYAAGRGVEQNSIEAAKWYLRAKAAGLEDALMEEMLKAMTPEDLAIATKAAMDTTARDLLQETGR